MPPAFSWFLAVRYLTTRWVNLIGTVGIALAVWAMIVVIAVFSGFIGDTEEGVHEATPDLLLTELPQDADYTVLAPLLATDPDVVATAPRLTLPALISPRGGGRRPPRSDLIGMRDEAGSNNIVLLVGIDTSAEDETTGFTEWIARVGGELHVADESDPFRVPFQKVRRFQRGTNMLLGDREGILLSTIRLKYGDNIQVGQEVNIVSARLVQDGDEFVFRPIKMDLHFAGAYATDHRFLDRSMCLVDIELMRNYMGEDPFDGRELVTDVAIKVRDGADLSVVTDRIDKIVENETGGKAITWKEQNAIYLGAVDQERILMKVVLFAVLAVAGFLIFATLHMMVVQKTKDIGILTSMGATPGGIGALFVVSGMAIGSVGCAAGLISGYLSAFFLNDITQLLGVPLFPPELYALNEVPINLELMWMVQVAGGALVLSLLVTWLPARRAARMDPIKALMHE